MPYVRKLKDTLEPLGIKFVTLHADREQKLWRRLNMHAVPCLAFVIDGMSYPYKDTITNNPKIIGKMEDSKKETKI